MSMNLLAEEMSKMPKSDFGKFVCPRRAFDTSVTSDAFDTSVTFLLRTRARVGYD